MRRYEFEGRDIFKKNGIPVPEGRMVDTSEQARDTFAQLQPAVVKVLPGCCRSDRGTSQ